MSYNFSEIQDNWNEYWKENETYRVEEDSSKKKYYVLDMFPYPSGAGLHVGHPLGYIASDIYSRYKRMKGFNVLHPMGFDAFGLPAEQYAIQTGKHPEDTTVENIATYKSQLNKIGLGFDWSREVRTNDPNYYKWTQKIFAKFFESWYNYESDKSENIISLVEEFDVNGNLKVNAAHNCELSFNAEEWKSFSKQERQSILLSYRMAYTGYAEVNWCEELGTVLANDEVKDGFSERGNFPVVKKKMRQWFLRISAYSQRLLDGLENLDWSESMKEVQRNWIGKSQGAEVDFDLVGNDNKISVFTTRPDTIYGSSFMVLAPEHELVQEIVTDEQRTAINEYIEITQSRLEKDRMADTKSVSGVFTGVYAVNPFTNDQIPVYISDYVLMGYGTGAIMAVPAHDARDYAFAKHFNLSIQSVIEGADVSEVAVETKEGVLCHSDILNGLKVKKAINTAINEIEKKEIGVRKINYRLRDAGFSRQRYWGEPFPIVYQDNLPFLIDDDQFPVTLPKVESYNPTGDGESPLAGVDEWVNIPEGTRETNTMPGNAGSSWYFLRYMSPNYDFDFVESEAESYWQNVDLYIGGAEHATGHLLYARFWQKFLFDLNLVTKDEPFQKMINQGMIQGKSALAYRINGTNQFVSFGHKNDFDVNGVHVDVNIVQNDELDIEAFKKWRPEYATAEFILEDGKFLCGSEVEKMSKRWYNVVNPDDVIAKYGADTFRMYEMFLGPIEQHKPWDTNGIDGVSRFFNKLWRLFYNDEGELNIDSSEATKEEMKIIHKTIKKVNEDIERFSFNTSVSAFMVCVNELSKVKSNNKEVLSLLIRLLSPFGPYISEELWKELGNTGSVTEVDYPIHDDFYLKENTFEYPVSVNGKMRAKVNLPIDMDKDAVEKEVLELDVIKKWLEGNAPKKVIVVPKRIVNIVV